MTTKTWTISANGTSMGTYAGDTEADAALAYARDAGYETIEEAAEVCGKTRENFINALEIEAIGYFAFRAWNSETLYGRGTQGEADRYEDVLNADRDVNVYSVKALTDREVEALDPEGRNDVFEIALAFAA